MRRTGLSVMVAGLMGCGGGLKPLPPATAPAPSAEPTIAGRALPDDAEVLRARELMVPVDGIGPDRLSDTYAASRGERGIHAALDIMAPRGTRVVAADAGRVWKVRSNALGGKTIYTIDAEERFVYYYAHLDQYADGLQEGQSILRGDLLGYVGTTGNAPPNVPHLHFQVMRYRGDGRWWDGTPLDPRPFLSRPGQVNDR